MEAYCCETMRHEIGRVSDRPPDQYGRRPNCLIHYSPDIREYGLFDHDRCSAGTTAVLGIYFCPWCGTRLPESLRDRWFVELEALGIDPNGDEVPDRFRSSEWWAGTHAEPGAAADGGGT
ncbi:MAG: DUF6980 family protein [Gemmataceae bacterium]